jgi:MFS superfamily sulfate permease-like transporter
VFRPRSPEHPEDEIPPGLLIARPEGRIYFVNVGNVGGKLQDMLKTHAPQVILLDCSAMPGIEYTALKMLVEAEERLRGEGTELWLAALNPEVLELVLRTPLAERLGRARMFFTVEQAVAAYTARHAADTAA